MKPAPPVTRMCEDGVRLRFASAFVRLRRDESARRGWRMEDGILLQRLRNGFREFLPELRTFDRFCLVRI